MADTKITDLAELAAAPAAADELVLVDDSDTTMAASGTNKRINVSKFLKAPTLGEVAGDTLTVNAGIRTIGSNYVATRAGGVSASGDSSLLDYAVTLSGHADGTSNVRAWRTYATASGTNNIAAVTGSQMNAMTETTAGTTAILYGAEFNAIVAGAGAVTTASGLTASVLPTSTGNIANANIVSAAPQLFGAGNITNSRSFYAVAPVFASTGAITNNIGFEAANLGHATLVANAIGFEQKDFTLGAATLQAGFRSLMTSGTGKWGFYSSGTAASAFAGSTRFGSVVAPTKTLDVTGNLGVLRAAGALSAGTTTLHNLTSTFSGDAGGATDGRGLELGTTASGVNSMALAIGLQMPTILTTSAGTTSDLRGLNNHVEVGGAGAATNAYGMLNSVVLSSTGAVTAARGINTAFTLSSSGGITTADNFLAGQPTLSSTGTISTLYGFRAQNLGHATLVANAIGFDHSDFTAATTLTVGFRSAMSSGTGKWAFYSSGTANNAFAGRTVIGSTTAPSATYLSLPAGATGDSPLRIAQGVAPTSPVDGDIWTTALGAFTRTSGGTRGPYGYNLFASGANIPDKGNVTTEQTFVTVTIPANSMGANGMLRITTAWTCTSSTNDKTARVKFGGTNLHESLNATTGVISMQSIGTIQNRNATNAQSGSTGTGVNLAATALPTAAIDTTADVTLLITGQKETGTETLTLQRYTIEMFPAA